MSSTVRPIDPLQSSVPIVDAAGRPTAQFIRQWSQARNINVQFGDATLTIAEVQALLAEVQAAVAALEALAFVLESRTISAGTGLSGGGDLSADRTFSITNTGVAAGTYGSATHVAQVTVNAQGQLTAVSEVAIV